MSIFLIILGWILVGGPAAFGFMLFSNKMTYGAWLIFPWSYNNPYKVKLRESDARLKKLHGLWDESKKDK